MNHKVNLEGFEGQNVEVKTSFWSAPKLLVDGNPAPKGAKRGKMILQNDQGDELIASWKQQLLGFDLPQLIVDGKVITLVEPLKWYQYLWGGWPLLLLFVGGALGALAGILSFVMNTKVFRSEMSEVLKYVIAGLVCVSAVVAYFVAATIFTLLING